MKGSGTKPTQSQAGTYVKPKVQGYNQYKGTKRGTGVQTSGKKKR